MSDRDDFELYENVLKVENIATDTVHYCINGWLEPNTDYIDGTIPPELLCVELVQAR